MKNLIALLFVFLMHDVNAQIKGSGVQDIKEHLGVIAPFAIVLIVWAVVSYRKRS
jgi:ABC-type uncharacterized transport system permease subunit